MDKQTSNWDGIREWKGTFGGNFDEICGRILKWNLMELFKNCEGTGK